jgi:hypothetical protein
VFDHPAAPQGRKDWYWSYEWAVSNPAALLRHVRRLCREFSRVTAPYGPRQINQGLWLLLGACLDVPRMLADPAIPWSVRRSCIAAMPGVYRDHVATLPANQSVETCFWMWFDLVGDAVSDMPAGTEKIRVADTVFRTLQDILALADPWCQLAALHGLGHLPHPKRAAVVARWLKCHRRRLDPATARWVRACQAGTVL